MSPWNEAANAEYIYVWASDGETGCFRYTGTKRINCKLTWTILNDVIWSNNINVSVEGVSKFSDGNTPGPYVSGPGFWMVKKVMLCLPVNF